ncbi:hypothetical protein Ocin01_13277 [Orchesella cincta]|uniref:Uncharacterized protein n=1 Tax=Orchesella cincta TaxID=48709 RepID=A0A1D2MK98_ORCCI|nr:hypothetical protein Ocin01_13277 [Orchesella cincta]
MLLKTWIPLGSLILLLCAHHGDATLILGSMLMTAAAAMTGGLIMGPLTVGGLIMMMMMAANQQAQQRTQTAASTPSLTTTLENSQNLLNLLSTLTGAASNLATSATSKRALYSPQNLEQLLASSSRATSTRRSWKSIPQTTTTTQKPFPNFFNSNPSPYFSPSSGFAVEPIPDDLLEIAMRLPQASSDKMARDFDASSMSHGGPMTGSGSGFSNLMMTASPPLPISDEQLRWVGTEPGDLFSSFPQVKEEDLLNFVRKRSTREALESTFRLEDIANVTYANEDPSTKEKISEREKQEDASPPSTQSGVLNDYAYLMKTVFTRDDDEDDEEDDTKAAASSTSTSTTTKVSGSGNKKKKVLNYSSKTPSKTKSKNDTPENDKNDEDEDDDAISSEEIPLDDEEVERLMMKEAYEMEQAANEELLDEGDPGVLPFVLKSASKSPPYLGPDGRPHYPSQDPLAPHMKGPGAPPSRPSGRPGQVSPPLFDAIKYRTEDLEKMSPDQLDALLSQVSSYPGETMRMEPMMMEEEEEEEKGGLLTRLMPQVNMAFSRKKPVTGNNAFDEDPFFDGFKRSLADGSKVGPTGSDGTSASAPKLRKIRRVVRKVPSGGVGYLRRVKRELQKAEDPYEVFRMAAEAGTKTKSSRQCRFLFNSCPLQLYPVALSNAQQLLAGSTRTTSAPVSADIIGNLATIGPNIVTFAPETPAPPQATTPPPPLPVIHQMQMPQNPPQTVVVPQIIQVPMPMGMMGMGHHHQAPPPPPQQLNNKQPIFNFIQNSGGSSGGSSSEGMTTFSHELPTGEKLEINLRLKGSGNNKQAETIEIPIQLTKTQSHQHHPFSPAFPKVNKNGSRLLDLFDDDRFNTVGSLKIHHRNRNHEPPPTASENLDSLQAAILAISKINEYANDRTKVKPFSEDDEKDDFKISQKLTSSLQRPIIAVEATKKRPGKVPPGLRQPTKKPKLKNKKKEEPNDDEEESSEEEEDEDEEDERDNFHYANGAGPRSDPMDPHGRTFIPLQVSTSGTRRLDEAISEGSSEEFINNSNRRVANVGSSSEEDEEEHGRMMRRRYRRPKILYPQDDIGKPQVQYFQESIVSAGGKLSTTQTNTTISYLWSRGGGGMPGAVEKRMIKARRQQRRRLRMMYRLNKPSAHSRAIMKRTLEIANERV